MTGLAPTPREREGDRFRHLLHGFVEASTSLGEKRHGSWVCSPVQERRVFRFLKGLPAASASEWSAPLAGARGW